jgi:hypothetical protein
MYVPDIIEVKDHLEQLKKDGLVLEWELPYENILTRRSAALFFYTPASEAATEQVATALSKYANFSYRNNHERKLSTLQYRVTFSVEEKEKNEAEVKEPAATN